MSGGGSAAIPLSESQSAGSYIVPVASIGFEGIAFLNPTGSQVTVTVQALNLESLATTASVTLNPGQLSAPQRSQFFSGRPACGPNNLCDIVRTDRRHCHQSIKRLHQSDCVSGNVN